MRFKVNFGRARCGQTYLAIPGKPSGKAEPAATRAAESPSRPPVSRVARFLALAYYVERQVEAGAIKDYAEAARILGMSRARMTQVMNLRWLPIRTQGAIVLGERTVNERGLRGGKE